ncbi:MAG: MBL fold metallo-hydrolase [Gammaproteobacteria bacterium]
MNKENIKLRYAASFESINNNDNCNYRYDIDSLKPGINFQDRHIVKLSKDKQVDWVVSRICDHASGTLQPCKNSRFAECPLHGWKLDLDQLQYSNVNVSKEKLAFEITNNEVVIHQPTTHLKLPENISSRQQEHDLYIRFLAHASLLFTCDSINIITDPWIQGPCFLNGWWHDPAPSHDAMEKLLNADLVYISHNHPDHMHEETLLKVFQHRPDIPIIIPSFKTKSAENPLRNLGFTNVIPLAFNQIHKLGESDIYLSILKSGDFRDDSGLYLSYGQKQALITVDSSALNHYVLPTDIDFLATSFAAGASGHPWCFDHYSEDKKSQITYKRHLSVKKSISKYIDLCKPKSYMPYAGYFSEAAPRDEYIKKNNIKNSQQSIASEINNLYPNIITIDPINTDKITISKSIAACSSKVARTTISRDEIQRYLDHEQLPEEEIFFSSTQEYFLTSQFKDDLILYLLPCESDFTPLGKGLIIDFSQQASTKILNYKDVQSKYNSEFCSQRQLCIKVRATSLWQVIQHHKSWEELSIGFHCRIHRKPDVYNSDFWYHFSNIYIK